MTIILRGCAQVPLPDEHKSEVLGMYVHGHSNEKDYIKNYKYKNGFAYLPLNSDKLAYISRLLDEPIVDQRSEGEPLSSPFVINPDFKFRDHQTVPAAQLLAHCQDKNYGVLSAQCGAGKTLMMSYVAGKLGCKILILVDMSNLQTQWQEAFSIAWNREVQVITKDTKSFSDISVCTFQLLHSNPELVLSLREAYGCLLLDEFQSTGSSTRREILFKLSNKYRIGCSATVYKKGYQDDVLTDFVSSVSVVVKDSSAMKASVQFVETGRAWYSSNPDDWGKIQSKLGKDEVRNNHIAKLAIAMATAGRKVLLIGITVESLQYVNSILIKDPFCRPLVYVGSTTLKQDQELRADVASGKVNIVLSVKKFDKGIDCPSLDCLILARPANNQSFTVQIAGRIVRPAEGKNTPLILDMVDHSSLAERFAKNRGKWYKQLGYTVPS